MGGCQHLAGGGGVSILCRLAGGMPLAFTQEDFLVVVVSATIAYSLFRWTLNNK